MLDRGGGGGEAVWSETSSLLSYTLRYVSFADVGSVCRVALRVLLLKIQFILQLNKKRLNYKLKGVQFYLPIDISFFFKKKGQRSVTPKC